MKLFKNRFMGIYLSDDMVAEERRRAIMLVGLSLPGILFFTIFTVSAFLRDHVLLGMFGVVTSAGLALNLVDAARRMNHRINARVGLGLVSVCFVYLLFSGGINYSAGIWYVIYPLAAFCMLGGDEGNIAAGIMLVPLVADVVLEIAGRSWTGYGLDMAIRMTGVYLMIWGFSFLFERTLEKHQRRLDRINTYLEDKVRQRTAQLVLVNEELKKDIRERRKLEEQLLRAEKMEAIGTLAGGIAHDFNNILSGILGYADLAKMDLDHPAEMAECLDEIISGAQKASDLVQQILAVSRNSALEKKPVQLSRVVEEAMKLLRATIPATIEIKTRLLSRGHVMADAAKMHQIVMNLGTNAYHAMGEGGGTLSVTLYRQEVRGDESGQEMRHGQYLRLEVADTGHGMAPDVLKKIFNPYYSTKASGKGTGLGLAVVFGIVREHKGYIDVDSYVGKGSVFIVHLPVFRGRVKEGGEAQSKALSASGGTGTIMFVDDEPSIRKIGKNYLERKGYAVHCFAEAVSALGAYEENPSGYNLIITDMTMPGMTGLSLIESVKGINPGQKVILCTGYSESIEKESAVAMGITYMEKPVAMAELAGTVGKLLAGKVP
ncbi:MAG: response regulator [Desulfobacter sp.]|nr:MAG: response regulator [Desulfobacter sp.]